MLHVRIGWNIRRKTARVIRPAAPVPVRRSRVTKVREIEITEMPTDRVYGK